MIFSGKFLPEERAPTDINGLCGYGQIWEWLLWDLLHDGGGGGGGGKGASENQWAGSGRLVERQDLYVRCGEDARHDDWAELDGMGNHSNGSIWYSNLIDVGWDSVQSGSWCATELYQLCLLCTGFISILREHLFY